MHAEYQCDSDRNDALGHHYFRDISPTYSEDDVDTSDWVYCLSCASHVIQVIQTLQELETNNGYTVEFLTILNYLDVWIIRIKPGGIWSSVVKKYIQKSILDIGHILYPNLTIKKVFKSLEHGISMVTLMQKYRIAIIDHGQPRIDEVEIFCKSIIEGLGYCPNELS